MTTLLLRWFKPMPWPCGCSRSDMGGSFGGWVLGMEWAKVLQGCFQLIITLQIIHVQWCSITFSIFFWTSWIAHSFSSWRLSVYQHPNDLEERCREDPDLVLAAVSGDGRCLALSSLQYDESFVREVRWVVRCYCYIQWLIHDRGL